eukprot:CAMPEP_0118850040 /NCGR_PEP_ID=MMETSP1163-20130328/85_1 /TAXON_ID=124430 /ORGANISM="Phaeomonas parva, Strain CCMP2877" /LENGTH=181 /DNA_ID=CAMNT_0006782237 /DNA_START=79 /DNA_END=624 /DNA_ORIENTATION=-
MSAAQIEEATQEVLGAAAEAIDFLASNGLAGVTVDGLRGLVEAGDIEMALLQTKEYAFMMAYLDHPALVVLLTTAWEKICAKLKLELKKATKRLENLEADKKTEPEALAAAQATLATLETRIANAKIKFLHLRNMRDLEEVIKAKEERVAEKKRAKEIAAMAAAKEAADAEGGDPAATPAN